MQIWKKKRKYAQEETTEDTHEEKETKELFQPPQCVAAWSAGLPLDPFFFPPNWTSWMNPKPALPFIEPGGIDKPHYQYPALWPPYPDAMGLHPWVTETTPMGSETQQYWCQGCGQRLKLEHQQWRTVRSAQPSPCGSNHGSSGLEIWPCFLFCTLLG